MNAITKMPLNQGQQEAAEAFFAFLFSEEKEMIISGPGGTGKTFLMGHLIDAIMPRYYDTCKLMSLDPMFHAVEMSATTNKSAEQLGLASGRPTGTTHSFMNLKVQNDYDTGQSRISKTRQWKVHEGYILFVDEYTLVDTPMMNLLHEGTHKCKIVYVGDHCQMAPVKEQTSPIDRRGLPFYKLTEPMRTNIPELHALNQQLRNTVETGEFKPIQIIPGIIDWLSAEQAEAEIQSVFLNPNHDARILAYTNKQVKALNDFIREVRQLPDEFTTGEKLINNNALQLKNRMLKVEEEIEIVSQAGDTEIVTLSPGAELLIRRTTIRTKFGEIFENIPIPVERPHFDALVKYYQGKKDWSLYYTLKEQYPDLRQRDASTVYKSQGSTYGTVYIDVSNLSTCHNPNQVARQLYVACSRAQLRVVFFGDLAQKYGGLLH